MPRYNSCKKCRDLGFIQKLHTCSRSWPLNREKMETADRQQQSVISDGGLQGLPSSFGSEDETIIAYSLNKRKRWMLRSLLEKAITDQEYRELDNDVPVSCFIRQVDRNWRRIQATAVSLSSTVFEGASPIRPNRSHGASFLTDLAVRALSKKPEHLRGQKRRPPIRTHARGAQRNLPQHVPKSSKERKLITEARNVDWGVMYHVGVANCNGPQRKRKCRFPVDSRYECDPYPWRSARQRTSVESADVYALDEFCEIELESYAEFLEDAADVDNLESSLKPNKTYDLEDFFNQEARTETAGTISTTQKYHSARTHVIRGETKRLAIALGLRADRVLVSDEFSDFSVGEKVAWEPESVQINPVLIHNMIRPITELIPDPEQTKSLITAQEYPADSQRTFFLPEDLTTADQILASEKMTVGAALGSRIIFSEVKLDVAACIIITPTASGLECCVKGPESWLRYLPEITSIPSLAKKLFHRLDDVSVSYSVRLHFVEALFVPNVNVLHPTCFLSGLLSSSRHLTQNQDLTTQFCVVCLDDSECMLKNMCGHVACQNCWKQHVMAKVSGGTATLLCMEPKCNVPVDTGVIGLVSPWWTLEAWQRRNLDVILASKDAAWCQTPKCRTIFLLDPAWARGTQTLLLCFRCDKRTCCTCLGEWHWPSPCVEAEKYHQLIQSSDDDPWHNRHSKKEKYFAKTKRCPSCHLVMEKGRGCDNMSCNCGAKFCWNCGQLTLEHYTNGEWVGCLRSIPLETIDVEEDTQLRWKEVAYRSAVQKRLLRYGLRFGRFKHFDADSKKAAYYAYHVMEYAFAYESQAPTTKLAKFIRVEMQSLEFLVQLMLENQEKPDKKVWCHGKIKSSLLRIRRAFSSTGSAV